MSKPFARFLVIFTTFCLLTDTSHAHAWNGSLTLTNMNNLRSDFISQALSLQAGAVPGKAAARLDRFSANARNNNDKSRGTLAAALLYLEEVVANPAKWGYSEEFTGAAHFIYETIRVSDSGPFLLEQTNLLIKEALHNLMPSGLTGNLRIQNQLYSHPLGISALITAYIFQTLQLGAHIEDRHLNWFQAILGNYNLQRVQSKIPAAPLSLRTIVSYWLSVYLSRGHFDDALRMIALLEHFPPLWREPIVSSHAVQLSLHDDEDRFDVKASLSLMRQLKSLMANCALGLASPIALAFAHLLLNRYLEQEATKELTLSIGADQVIAWLIFHAEKAEQCSMPLWALKPVLGTSFLSFKLSVPFDRYALHPWQVSSQKVFRSIIRQNFKFDLHRFYITSDYDFKRGIYGTPETRGGPYRDMARTVEGWKRAATFATYHAA
jgi:hypothetical protein